MAYFVEMAQTFASASGTLNANMPSHVTNDLLVAYVTVDSGTITPPAGWAALPSAPANPVSNGTITYLLYKLAAGGSETFSGVAVADAYTCGVYCFRDVDTTTPFDGVTPVNQSAGAAATDVTCSSVTTATANALVVYLCAFDGATPQALSLPGVMWIDQFDSTGTTATTSSHQGAAWYIQRSAGAAPTATFRCNASNASTRVTFALRNKSGGRIPAYIDDVSSPGTMITSAHHTAAVANVTFTGTLTNTASINGKTVASSAPTLGADFGINPYANAVGRTAAITAATALNGYEITLTAGRNFSTGLVMGSLIALNPKSGTFGLGSVAQGGLVVRFGSSATDWVAYQVAAKDTPITTEQRYVFAIQPGYTGSLYGAAGGSYNNAATTYMQVLMNCPAFASNEYLSELVQVFTQVIAGGDATVPVDIAGLVAVGRSFRLPVIQPNGAAGALSFAPIQIGGGDAVNFQVDAGAIQFPRRYDTVTKEIAFHADNNRVGLYLAGKSGDVIKLTNSVVTSPTPYVFEITSSATNAATWDLKGLTVVNANVTLRNVMTFQSMTFSACPSLVFSGCTLQNSTINKVPTTSNSLTADASTAVSGSNIDVSQVTAGNYWVSLVNPGVFSDCSFTGGGGHAIRLTTPGTYTLDGNTWTGFGSDGSTGAAIYNDSGGAVTLNITSGGAPTVRNGAGASTTVVAGSVTVAVTVLDTAGTPIQNARVLVYANTGGALPANASVTISRSGSTATVAHTGHGLLTGDKVVITGAAQLEYNGVFDITKIDNNSYSYIVSGTPATPATGTITATFAALSGLTDANGQLSTSRVYGSNQPVLGRVRKSSSAPYYKTAGITGTVDSSAGFSTTVQMILDQ